MSIDAQAPNHSEKDVSSLEPPPVNRDGAENESPKKKRSGWNRWGRNAGDDHSSQPNSVSDLESLKRPRKWTAMGMLNDPETDEVPGTHPLDNKLLIAPGETLCADSFDRLHSTALQSFESQ